jgi:hypothetical protein
MERIMQKPGEQLFAVELANVWNTAQECRGQVLAGWCTTLYQHVRTAIKADPHRFERRFMPDLASKLHGEEAPQRA